MEQFEYQSLIQSIIEGSVTGVNSEFDKTMLYAILASIISSDNEGTKEDVLRRFNLLNCIAYNIQFNGTKEIQENLRDLIESLYSIIEYEMRVAFTWK